MTFGDEAVELGKEVIGTLALQITPDDVLETIDGLVKTIADKEMTGQQKADWVKDMIIEMALDIWDLLIPIVVKSIYNIAKERGDLYVNGK